MPSLARRHDDGTRVVAAQPGIHQLRRFVEHGGLDGLALGVEHVEAFGQRLGFASILRGEQPGAQVRLSHPSARIDARPQNEP